MSQAIRVNMQILLENVYSFNVKAVELIDEATVEGIVPLGRNPAFLETSAGIGLFRGNRARCSG